MSLAQLQLWKLHTPSCSKQAVSIHPGLAAAEAAEVSKITGGGTEIFVGMFLLHFSINCLLHAGLPRLDLAISLPGPGGATNRGHTSFDSIAVPAQALCAFKAWLQREYFSSESFSQAWTAFPTAVPCMGLFLPSSGCGPSKRARGAASTPRTAEHTAGW